jgi:hypothetical protein
VPGTGVTARQISHWLAAEAYLRAEWNKLIADVSTLILNSGGLVISAGGSALAKTVNVIDFLINGVLATKAAGNMAALAGTITNGNFGGWVFTVDVAGTLRSRFMTQGASLAAVLMPAIPAGEAVIGFVRLNPTTADFVGGTTALDAANTNAIYRDTPTQSRHALGSGVGIAGPILSPVG